MGISGIINIIKPIGMTSHDVVNIVRKRFGIKKVGHTGTLDPGASGVLPICVGRATKIAQYIIGEDKTYIAEMKLGVATDTQDAAGNILNIKNASKIKACELEEAIFSFKGRIKQIPPMASAVKVKGQKLYHLHRKGMEIKRNPRNVIIHDIKILEMIGLGEEHPHIIFEVRCSKGTYIRTLCHDTGAKLGVGAHMTNLTRTVVGSFKIEDGIKLDDFMDMPFPQRALISIDELFDGYDEILIKPTSFKSVISGTKLYPAGILKKPDKIKESQLVKLKMNDNFIALAVVQLEEESGRLVFKPVFINTKDET